MNKKKVLAGFSLFSWALVVFVLSSMPSSNVSKTKKLLSFLPFIKHSDKIVHFGMYFVLSFVLMMFFFIGNKKISKTTIIIAFAIASIYGNLMEICQFILKLGRSCDIYDAIANSCGAMFGVLCFLLINRFIWHNKL